MEIIETWWHRSLSNGGVFWIQRVCVRNFVVVDDATLKHRMWSRRCTARYRLQGVRIGAVDIPGPSSRAARFTMEDSDLRKKSHELLRLSTNWTCAVCFANMPQ